MKVLTKAIHGVAASATTPATQQAIIQAAQVVMHESANLIEEAKRALENPTDKSNQQRMAKVRGIGLSVCNLVSQSFRHPGGGVVHDLRMDGGLPPCVQKGTLFRLPKLAAIPTFMMNFAGKPSIFDYFSPISG